MVKSSTLPIETIKTFFSLWAGPDDIKIQSLRQMGNSEEVRDRGKEEGREGGRLNVITTEGHPIGTYGANAIRFPRHAGKAH